MTRCANAGGAVDIGTDVALLGEERRAGVHPHAHLDPAGLQPGGDPLRGLERARGGREGEEEGVALGVDLGSALRRARLTDDAPVLGERLRVTLGAELVEQPRRALDVGEDECDGARGEVCAHGRDDALRRVSKSDRAGTLKPCC